MEKLPEMSAEEYKEMQNEPSMVDEIVRSPYENKPDENENRRNDKSGDDDHHHHDH